MLGILVLWQWSSHQTNAHQQQRMRKRTFVLLAGKAQVVGHGVAARTKHSRALQGKTNQTSITALSVSLEAQPAPSGSEIGVWLCAAAPVWTAAFRPDPLPCYCPVHQ